LGCRWVGETRRGVVEKREVVRPCDYDEGNVSKVMGSGKREERSFTWFHREFIELGK